VGPQWAKTGSAGQAFTAQGRGMSFDGSTHYTAPNPLQPPVSQLYVLVHGANAVIGGSGIGSSTSVNRTQWDTYGTSGRFRAIVVDNGGGVVSAESGITPAADSICAVIFTAAPNGSVQVFFGGAKASSSASTSFGAFTKAYIGAIAFDPPNNFYVDPILFSASWGRVLADNEAYALLEDPGMLLRPANAPVYFIPSAGGGGATITGSGTPTAQASTVSGTAERSVTGSGTPTAQASTVAGVAERVITSSGALASQSSAVAGSGSVGNAISGSGTLLAQSSQVAGTAERSVTGSGTPASQSATVSGAAERIVTGTGTPTSQSSTVSGTGQVGNVVTGSGSPTAQSATVSGTAERTVTSSGALSAQSSTVAGTAERTITGSGALSAQSSTVYGFDSAPVVPDTGGGGSRTVAFSSRKLRQELEEWEQKNQEKERLKRLMREDEELVLIMLALAA
jgi:hypothetical protein